MAKGNRKLLPFFNDLKARDEDLRARYEEILVLRAELDKLLARAKLSPKSKKRSERKKGWVH